MERGKEGLLPLKSFEKSTFVLVFRVRLRGDETRKFIVQVILLIVHALIVFTIFGFDYLFTRLLQLVQTHVDITFHQTGVHAIHFNIDGVGFMARLLRRVVSDFNFEHHLDIQHFTKRKSSCYGASYEEKNPKILMDFIDLYKING